MASISQPWLPEVKKVEKVVTLRKIPQPRVGKLKRPRKFELLYHPFDLSFRGRLSKWLEKVKASKKMNLDKVLDRESIKIISLYFFPQGKDKKWLNQDEVLRKTGISYKKKLKKELVRILLKIWIKTRNV
jgi:hypothetical protein